MFLFSTNKHVFQLLIFKIKIKIKKEIFVITKHNYCVLWEVHVGVFSNIIPVVF